MIVFEKVKHIVKKSYLMIDYIRVIYYKIRMEEELEIYILRRGGLTCLLLKLWEPMRAI